MKGYALRDDLGNSGPVMFPGFPGVWMPGESKSLKALGLDEDEAADMVKDLNLPLVAVSDAPDVNLDLTAGMVSNATGASEALEASPAVETEGPGQAQPVLTLTFPSSHAELDKLAKANDFEFPEDAKTVAEKQSALAAAGVKPEQEG